MTSFEIIAALVFIHVVGFWLLAWYAFRLRKRLRCLGFCYIQLGDWGIQRLVDARDHYIATHGEHVTPFVLLDAEQRFQTELASHRRYFAEIGLRPPGPRELNYPLEALGRF